MKEKDKDLVAHTVGTIGNFIKSTASKVNPDNVVNLGGNTYYVRTQAGLNKVVKLHTENGSTKEFDNHLIDYPRQFFYPAVVSIGFQYMGYHQMTVYFTRPEVFKAGLQQKIDLIEQSDEKHLEKLLSK